MAIGLAPLGLLAFLLSCSGTFAQPQTSELGVKCSLAGNWENDLKSTMEINSVNDKGVFNGVYKTAVSATGKSVPPSPLQGIQHQSPQPTFGFTVSWKVPDRATHESITVFVGQCFLDEYGKEQLRTTWLLRVKVDPPAWDWMATRVGTNIFWRAK